MTITTQTNSKRLNAATLTPGWMSKVLFIAAIYNVLFGAYVVFFPNHWFIISALEPPIYPGLWQCVGMVVGVYGVGYAIAAFNPLRHWPIVLVGFLGKILGPIGFFYSIFGGQFNWGFGRILITNDFIWWVPFSLILYAVYAQWRADHREILTIPKALAKFSAHDGLSLLDLSKKKPILLVLLRHSGCTFCREALVRLSHFARSSKADNIHIVAVTMSSSVDNAKLAEEYQLSDVTMISDPDRILYGAFELRRGALWQLFGLPVIIRGIKAGLFDGHGIGKLDGDGFQMPGSFLVDKGVVINSYKATYASDLPVPNNDWRQFCHLDHA